MTRNSKTFISSERELVVYLEKYFGKDSNVITKEVPNMGQNIDIVIKKGKWITAVEAKMHDWKRAINQCKTHEIIADYISIAIALNSVPKELEIHCINLGYGLIHCPPKEGICKTVLSPKLNKNIWKPQRKVFISHLKNLNVT